MGRPPGARAYDAIIIAVGGTTAEELARRPAWYYNGIAVVGFAVASLLFFNTLFLIGRTVGARARPRKNPGFSASLAADARRVSAAFTSRTSHVRHFGGPHWLVHVCDREGRLCRFRPRSNTAAEFTIGLRAAYVEQRSDRGQRRQIDYCTVKYDVYKDGNYIGSVSPAVQLAQKPSRSWWPASSRCRARTCSWCTAGNRLAGEACAEQAASSAESAAEAAIDAVMKP